MAYPYTQSMVTYKRHYDDRLSVCGFFSALADSSKSTGKAGLEIWFPGKRSLLTKPEAFAVWWCDGIRLVNARFVFIPVIE